MIRDLKPALYENVGSDSNFISIISIFLSFYVNQFRQFPVRTIVFLNLNLSVNDICSRTMMTPFEYKYQNPSGFACLMLIGAIVIFTSLGIQNFNKKRKTN